MELQCKGCQKPYKQTRWLEKHESECPEVLALDLENQIKTEDKKVAILKKEKDSMNISSGKDLVFEDIDEKSSTSTLGTARTTGVYEELTFWQKIRFRFKKLRTR